MRQIKITNQGLHKPVLLITLYDVVYDCWATAKRKYDGYEKQFHNSVTGVTNQMRITLAYLKDEVISHSEKLKHLDEQIHSYIKTHQA